MIFTERTITIRNDSASINTPVILYRGDKNVEVRFTLVESPYKYSNRDSVNIIESTDAAYAQLIIKTPNDRDPIFGDITAVGQSNIIFVIEYGMIDEIGEVGEYDFQIRLFDSDQTSMVTLPEVVSGFIIKEPIAKEDTTNNITNSAIVGSAVVTSDVSIPTFVGGSYNKTAWDNGTVISRQKLDKIEDGIYETYELSKDNSSQIKEKVTKGEGGVITNAMLSQEVKESMTGGSVAVVGKDSVSMDNLMYDIKNNIYDICSPNKEVLLSSNLYGCNLDDNENTNISIKTDINEEFNIWLTNDNLFNVEDHRDYNKYLKASDAYYASPIYLKPNTTYTVYAFYKYNDGESNNIGGTNIFINQDFDTYASGGSALSLKNLTSSTSQDLTTNSTGCLYVTPVFGSQEQIDQMFNAFDIMIVEKDTEVNKYIKGVSKKYNLRYKQIVNTNGFSNIIINTEKTLDNIRTALPNCDIRISKKELDYTTLKNKMGLEQKEKKPLIYYTENWASFWYNNNIPTGLEGTNSYLKVKGNKGESKLTVINGGNFELSSIDGFTNWGAVLGYGDGTYKSCLVISHDSSTNIVNIYPPLEKDITDGELGNMSIDGMHLTKLGYRAYMQHNYSQNPKHCEKGKYLHKFAPSTNGLNEPVPFKLIEGSHRLNCELYKVNKNTTIQNTYGITTFYVNNPWDELTEEKAGIYWEVPLYSKEGYLELMVSGIGYDGTSILFDDGFEMHIEFYLDDKLQEHIIKKNRNLDRLCFDFKNAATGKIVIYYNKMRINNETICISDSTWWINEYEHGDKLIPDYSVVSQLFDSWGAYHDGESGKEMSRIINKANGLTIPYYNTSKGSQTSAWGRSWWFENVLSNRPNIMITDFGINDCNSIPYNLPETVTGSDGVEYNNRITKELYKENLNDIFTMCLYNNIQPIMFGGTMGADRLGEWYLYLTYGTQFITS